MVTMLKKSDTMAMKVTTEDLELPQGSGSQAVAEAKVCHNKGYTPEGTVSEWFIQRQQGVNTVEGEGSQCQNSEVKCLAVTW